MSDTLATNIPRRPELRQRSIWLLLFAVVLLACFSKPLIGLVRLALNNDLYSYILLVPAISAYLVWFNKRKLDRVFVSSPRVAIGLLTLGLALIAAYLFALAKGWTPGETDRLCVLILAMLFCFSGGLVWWLGGRMTRSIAFPIAFLIFMVPMPGAMENGVTNFLQHASAEAAYFLLKISGMPIFREGTQFTMPGVSIEVAPECSGIHSSLVLFITGVLAAHFLLRKPWTRILLAASVIPLGIFRNAFRIFTLAQLAVHVNPGVLDSPLHHQGGPLFFAISMIPFLVLIWLFRKYESRRMTTDSNSSGQK